MRILTGQCSEIGLWGRQNLDVQSNSPNVVPNDGFLENMSRPDGLCFLSLFGKSAGTAMLECRLSGSPWCALQIQVVDVVELSARGYKSSTSTIFIWEKSGGKYAKHLRLDYGYNVKTKTVGYHWNRKGAAKEFGEFRITLLLARAARHYSRRANI